MFCDSVPLCGKAVKPEHKFCRNCGASLRPDLSAAGEAASPQPVQPVRFLRVSLTGIPSRNGLIAVAGLVIIALIIIFTGYPLLMVPGTATIKGISTSPAPVLSVIGGPGDYPGRLSLIIETETPKPFPATEPLIGVTTIVPTPFIPPCQTTVQVTQSIT